jgi:hypothetical protein
LCYDLTIKIIIAGYAASVKNNQPLQRRNTMGQTGFQPYLIVEVKRYQQEIISKVHQYEMLAEVRKISNPKNHRESKIMALLGKELTTLGMRLEAKYGNPHEDRQALVKLSNPGGCD